MISSRPISRNLPLMSDGDFPFCTRHRNHSRTWQEGLPDSIQSVSLGSRAQAVEHGTHRANQRADAMDVQLQQI
jgi:hypothetical protein